MTSLREVFFLITFFLLRKNEYTPNGAIPRPRHPQPNKFLPHTTALIMRVL